MRFYWVDNDISSFKNIYAYDGAKYYNMGMLDYLTITRPYNSKLYEISNDAYNVILLEVFNARLVVHVNSLFLRVYSADYKISIDFCLDDIKILNIDNYKCKSISYESYSSLLDLFGCIKND